MRLESFDNPSEYVLYHVGRTHLHRHLDADQYFAVRVEEDRWAFLQQFNRWPPNVLEASRIMVHLYRTFTQHKWLPLQTAWPFNLRMVAFVLMHTDSAEAIVADKLVQRIRSWGCPVSPFADGHDAWARSNNRDVMFNRFRDLTGRLNPPHPGGPSQTYQSATSPVTRDLDRIAAMIRAGR